MKFSTNDFIKHYAAGNAPSILAERALYQQGISSANIHMYRYVVLDVITDSTPFAKLSDEDAAKKIDYWKSLNVSNMQYLTSLPRNTVIAKRLNSTLSSQANDAQFLFPLLPSNIALPCKPGEHIWVMFESSDDRSLGYWLCKITEVGFVDDVNHTHAPRMYETSFFPSTVDLTNDSYKPDYNFRPGKTSYDVEGNKITLASTAVVNDENEKFYEDLITSSDASKLMTYEAIPRFRKRPGDVAIEGSNNSLIVLGTDRTGPVSTRDNKKVSDDAEKNAGSIDLVVGRGQTSRTSGKKVRATSIDGKTKFHEELNKTPIEVSNEEGDPDIKNDRSRVLITQKSRTDKNLGLSDKSYHASTVTPGDPITSSETQESGAIVIKSDKIRLIARSDVEIIVSGYEKDENGQLKSLENTDNYAAIIIKTNGDIILRPSGKGVLKLGGEDANLAVLCNAQIPGVEGIVTSQPIIDTMGGSQGQGGPAGQFATKVLLK